MTARFVVDLVLQGRASCCRNPDEDTFLQHGEQA